MNREWSCTLEHLLEAAMGEAEGTDEWWEEKGLNAAEVGCLVKLKLSRHFIFILTSVSEYSNIPWAPPEAFRSGIYKHSEQSNQQVAWAIKV